MLQDEIVMVKKCPICGENNSEEAVICINCGERIRSKENLKEQQIQPKYEYKPRNQSISIDKRETKKSSKRKWAVLLLIILIVATLFIIYIFPMFSTISDNQKFIGRWSGTREYHESGYTLIFYENETFKWSHQSFTKTGFFSINEIKDGKFVEGELFLEWTNSYGSKKTDSFTYYFSENATKLHLMDKDTFEGYVFVK